MLFASAPSFLAYYRKNLPDATLNLRNSLPRNGEAVTFPTDARRTYLSSKSPISL